MTQGFSIIENHKRETQTMDFDEIAKPIQESKLERPIQTVCM